MDETLLYGIFGLLGLYLILRWFTSRKITRANPVDAELAQVIDGDEHKVKGRYE